MSTIRTAEEWEREYRESGALWLHDGNPKRPHVLLSSGARHSAGFFNSELVMEDSSLLDEACFDLIRLLVGRGLDIDDVDRVVGPAMGAITIADGIARNISLERSGSCCLYAYTENVATGLMFGEPMPVKMAFRRATIHYGEKILVVDDVLTSGENIISIADAVTNARGVVLPFVGVLVNRSGLTEVSGRKIVALINCPMPKWAPEECPLCKEGSQAIRPKGVENWARLNAT